MIRAIIIEDEPLIRQEINSLLQRFFLMEVAVVAEADTVLEGVKALETFKPSLLFLDVHLPDGTGFDIIQKSDFKDFEIIFITGYDTNAIQAIKVGALDYLLKPIDETEFRDAVKKVIEANGKQNDTLETSLEVTQEHFSGKESNRIILKTNENVHAVFIKEILYCQSDGNYTTVYLENEEQILLSKHIKKIEEILPRATFFRCHQSFLVNKNHVRKFNKQGFLLLTSNAEIPVSGRRREFTLKNIFN